MIFSENGFLWFNSLWILGIVIIWGIHDAKLLASVWRDRREKHDEWFGAILGLVMVAIGAIGLIKHHLEL